MIGCIGLYLVVLGCTWFLLGFCLVPPWFDLVVLDCAGLGLGALGFCLVVLRFCLGVQKCTKMLRHSPIFDGALPGEDAQTADMHLLL